MFPNALLLSAQVDSYPTEGVDGIIPLPISPRDLQLRLPELQELKQLKIERSLEPRPGDGITDPLTGFYTFPHFKEVLFLELKRARRYGYPIAIAMAAPDAPEAALSPEERSRLFVAMALGVKMCLRDTDFPVQYSSDRLLLLLPHTDLQGAVTVSQRMCERSHRLSLSIGGHSLRPSLSVGVSAAGLGGKPVSLGDLVRRARLCLDFAVQGGGNRVEFFDSVADALALEADFLGTTLPASA
jgi:PleD family two-component response regulator